MNQLTIDRLLLCNLGLIKSSIISELLLYDKNPIQMKMSSIDRSLGITRHNRVVACRELCESGLIQVEKIINSTEKIITINFEAIENFKNLEKNLQNFNENENENFKILKKIKIKNFKILKKTIEEFINLEKSKKNLQNFKKSKPINNINNNINNNNINNNIDINKNIDNKNLENINEKNSVTFGVDLKPRASAPPNTDEAVKKKYGYPEVDRNGMTYIIVNGIRIAKSMLDEIYGIYYNVNSQFYESMRWTERDTEIVVGQIVDSGIPLDGFPVPLNNYYPKRDKNNPYVWFFLNIWKLYDSRSNNPNNSYFQKQFLPSTFTEKYVQYLEDVYLYVPEIEREESNLKNMTEEEKIEFEKNYINAQAHIEECRKNNVGLMERRRAAYEQRLLDEQKKIDDYKKHVEEIRELKRVKKQEEKDRMIQEIIKNTLA